MIGRKVVNVTQSNSTLDLMPIDEDAVSNVNATVNRVSLQRVSGDETETCTGSKTDIVWLVDESGSVGPEPYKQGLEFIAKFVDKFTLGEDATRIGLITWGEHYTPRIPLNKFYDKELLKKEIRSIEWAASWYDNVYEAYEYCQKNCFNPSVMKARKDSKKILIFLGDHPEHVSMAKWVIPFFNNGTYIIGLIISTDDWKEGMTGELLW